MVFFNDPKAVKFVLRTSPLNVWEIFKRFYGFKDFVTIKKVFEHFISLSQVTLFPTISWVTPQPNPPPKTKKSTRKKSLTFKEMELYSSNIMKSVIFSQEKVFLIFQKTESYTFQPKLKKYKKSTPGKFIILQETRSPKKIVIFQKTETSKRKF